jgi:hypothetical protein
MTKENRETMQRALGILEGVSYCGNEEVQDALATACVLIEFVLREEEVK